MGYYINVPANKHKADQLVEIHGAEKLPKAPGSFFTVEGKALVAVVENPDFDAAAYCYDAKEFTRFTATPMTEEQIERKRKETEAKGWGYIHIPSGPRPVTWLLMDKDLVEKLSGYTQAVAAGRA